MLKKILFLVALFVLLSGYSGFCQAEQSLVKVGQHAPDFTVKTINNKVITLKDLEGKYVLLNFFATWCKPCMKELPYVEKDIYHRFDSDNFVVIAIGREHSINELQLFNESKGFSFHIAADPKRTIYGLYASKYIPRNYLISPEGVVLYENSGFSKSEFENLVKLIEDKVR